jgi:hypothetical protein
MTPKVKNPDALVRNAKRIRPIRLKTIITKGKGLVSPMDWNRILDLSYRDHAAISK